MSNISIRRTYFALVLPGRIEFLLVLHHLSGRGPDVGFQMIFEDLPMNRVHGPVVGPRHDTHARGNVLVRVSNYYRVILSQDQSRRNNNKNNYIMHLYYCCNAFDGPSSTGG